MISSCIQFDGVITLCVLQFTRKERKWALLINVVCERYVTFMVVHLLFLLISNGAGCSAPTCFLNFFVLREPTLIDPLSIFLKHLAGSP
jgi:hypothetical protein